MHYLNTFLHSNDHTHIFQIDKCKMSQIKNIQIDHYKIHFLPYNMYESC